MVYFGVSSLQLIYYNFALPHNTSFSSGDGCQDASNEPRLEGRVRISVSIGNAFPKKRAGKVLCASEKG